MTGGTATRPARRLAKPGSPLGSVRRLAKPGSPLGSVRRLGYLLLAAELAGFVAWSAVVYSRSALTYDYAQYSQAWMQIAHGNLNPYDSMHALWFWQNNSEFIMWPLALLYWVWPHGITLLWLADAGVVAAQAVAFTWICQIAGRHGSGRKAALLAGAGCVLLVANPWVWLSVSNDFHVECISVVFAALLAFDLANRRRRAWAWVPVLLACGDVAASYVIGLGAGALLAQRGNRLRGAVITVLGAAWILFIAKIHGNLGSGNGFRAFAYLAGPAASSGGAPLSPAALAAGIARRPLMALHAIWAKRDDVLANLCPGGLLGLGFPALLPLVLAVAGPNTLYPSVLFAQPSFQSLPVYVLMPAGTVAALSWLARRRRWPALALGGLVLAQALAWSAVWLPTVPVTWLRTPAAAAAVLSRLEARVPRSAEVVASDGVMGRFSGRAHLYMLFARGGVPVHGETWFVVAPGVGINSPDTARDMAFIGRLAGRMHATLMLHAGGIWAFRWHPPAGTRWLAITRATRQPLPGWTGIMPDGGFARRILSGPVRTWHATMPYGHGYVAAGLAWIKPPGLYQASVTMSATGPASVEVWNDTGDVLLARRIVPATTGIQHVVMPVDARTAYPSRTFSGWGPFRAYFMPPPAGNRLEIRVWKLGSGTVSVYLAQLAGPCRASGAGGC
jgi:hypothetical protein